MGSLKTTIDQEKLIFAYALKKPQYLLSMGGDFYNNPEIQYLANNAKLFFQEYKEAPSCEQMKAIIKGDKKELSPEIVDSIYDVEITAYDDEFLKDTTEGWILFRSLNHNLFEAVTLVKTTDVTLENVRDVVRRLHLRLQIPILFLLTEIWVMTSGIQIVTGTSRQTRFHPPGSTGTRCLMEDLTIRH